MKRLLANHLVLGLSAVGLCLAACGVEPASSSAADDNDSETARSSVAQDEAVEPFDPVQAAAIAKLKRAALGSQEISPQAAACGTAGPTGTSVRVNDAAINGAARQRSGSSTGCTAPGELQPTDDALYFCFTFGSDGTWTYLQNIRTGVRGWTRDDLLRAPPGSTVGGAANFCGF